MIDTTNNATSCINALPDGGSLRPNLRVKLDQTATTVDTAVVAADQKLAAVLLNINRLQTDINSIASGLQSLMNLSSAIESVKSKLSVLLVPMQALQSVFSQEISIPYGGYPEICWQTIFGHRVFPYPCGWHTVYFSFSIQQILDGISGVLAPILALLESAMNAILNPLIAKLHLNFTLPAIPGLSDLENEVNAIQSAYKDLWKVIDGYGFANSMAAFTDAFNEVKSEAVYVQYLYNNCKGQP